MLMFHISVYNWEHENSAQNLTTVTVFYTDFLRPVSKNGKREWIASDIHLTFLHCFEAYLDINTPQTQAVQPKHSLY